MILMSFFKKSPFNISCISNELAVSFKEMVLLYKEYNPLTNMLQWFLLIDNFYFLVSFAIIKFKCNQICHLFCYDF